MPMKKLLLTLLAPTLALTTSAKDFTYEYEGQTLSYTVISETDKTCETMGGAPLHPGNNVTGHLIIPEEANGYTVTAIGAGSFNACYLLESVVLPSSITSISSGAFSRCQRLTDINIPASVTYICEEAFYNCSSLSEITIPASVTLIGVNAFSACTNLCDISVDSENSNYSSIDGVVFNKDLTTLETYPAGKMGDYKIPETVTYIGQGAFESCVNLTDITIPNGVNFIDDYAFYKCSGLTDLTLPNTVVSLGECVFEGCSSLKSVTIPNSITTISWSAFSGCSNLKKVIIPSSVTTIDNYAFDSCDSLSSIIIPPSVKTIGDRAFFWCESLLKAAYPSSLSNPFKSSVVAVAYNPQEVTFKGDWIYNNDGTEIVYAPIEESGNYIIPEGVTSIGRQAYGGCYNMTSITIPDAVTDISDGAFRNCENLTDVILPAELNTLGSGVFKGDKSLKNIVLRGEVPVKSDYNNFELPTYTDATLYVPGGSQALFKDVIPWSYFYKVTDKPYSSEINQIVSNNEASVDSIQPYDIYTHTGAFVGKDIKTLTPGFYIIRQGNLVKKFVVK